MIHRMENGSTCATCHHLRIAHPEGPEQSPFGTLKLRGKCMVAGCGCMCYIGVVWEAPIPVRNVSLIPIAATSTPDSG